MSEPAVDQTPAQRAAVELEKTASAVGAGANWFYWIAGLSLLNSAIVAFGGQWSFVIGLGATQIVDAFSLAATEELVGQQALAVRAVAFAMAVVPAAIFACFGWLARQRLGWAFLVGGALYAADGLIFVLVGDWLSVGFHVFALAGILSGFAALRRLRGLEGAAVAPAEPIPVAVAVGIAPPSPEAGVADEQRDSEPVVPAPIEPR
ncbi:MAG: hypothetical protein Kow0062_00720 [Acidobacteriota bacterium]